MADGAVGQARSSGEARIDSDAPTENDDLGREPYVQALSRIVQTAETPLVLAVYGAWGSGKTSLMMQLRRQLDPGHDGTAAGDQLARTVWFDPWMHQFDDSPALALLHAAADQLGIAKRRNVVSALSRIAVALGGEIQMPFVGIRVGKLLKIRDELAQDDFNRREERARLRSHFHDALAETGAADKRVVFFIDDLDRCQPPVALALLEALKLYLDVPGCVFVLGVDREPLEAAVGEQYATLGLRSESYLDKIIQLPFAIPAISSSAMDSFVAARLPESLSACAEILAAATVDEPRNVKRLANSLLVNHELAAAATFHDEYDPRLLAMVVLIQNRAPSLYRQLRLDPGLIRDLFDSRAESGTSDADGLTAHPGLWDLYISEKPRLERALGLIELPAGLDLTPYITLTSFVPVEPTDAPGREKQSVILTHRRADVGAEHAQRMRDALGELGWEVAGDIDIRPGEDLKDAVQSALSTSAAMLLLVGPGWAQASSPDGLRLLDSPADHVRSDIEAARNAGTRIIPVLMNGAQMPDAAELPDDLRFLATTRPLIMDMDNFRRGLAELDRALRPRSSAS